MKACLLLTLIVTFIGTASAQWPPSAPVVPISSNFSHWDHHWYIWLPRHPVYEAVEVMSMDTPGTPLRLVWVFFTERAGGKRQVNYVDNKEVAGARRIAPVTAHSIATINQLAPGRTILGVGTGFTGRNTMGLPPVPLTTMRDYITMCRALLRGEEVLYREGARERRIRFLHQHHGYLNLKKQIPIYMAANGPKALELTGELCDGLFTTMADPDAMKKNLATVAQGTAKAGRGEQKLPVVMLATGCVLRPGESAIAPRVVKRVGPFALVALHALWERSAVAMDLPPALRDLYARYEKEYIPTMKTPKDRLYLEMHEGHLIYLRPGEEQFVTESLVQDFSLTGSGEDIIARLKALEAAGVTQVALQVVTEGGEMIEEFSREVIAKY